MGFEHSILEPLSQFSTVSCLYSCVYFFPLDVAASGLCVVHQSCSTKKRKSCKFNLFEWTRQQLPELTHLRLGAALFCVSHVNQNCVCVFAGVCSPHRIHVGVVQVRHGSRLCSTRTQPTGSDCRLQLNATLSTWRRIYVTTYLHDDVGLRTRISRNVFFTKLNSAADLRAADFTFHLWCPDKTVGWFGISRNVFLVEFPVFQKEVERLMYFVISCK